MNYLIYLKAVGKNQGLISEKCSTKESIFTVHPGHEDEIYVIGLNYTAFPDKYTNINFKKLIDRSSPLLHQAIDENEELEMIFTFYDKKNSELKKEIKIKKAFIKKINMHASSFSSQEENYDEILLECHDFNLFYF